MFLDTINMNQRTRGDYTLRRIKKSTGQVMQEAYGPNILTNTYFDSALNGSPYYIKGVLLGSGSAVPQVTDTAIQSYLGGGTSFQGLWTTINSTVSPRNVKRGFRIRCAEGAVIGNVSEVAVYGSSSQGVALSPSSNRPILSRALIVDSFGNPTTVPVQSDEFLDVIYEQTFYAMDGITGVLAINIAGVVQNFNYEIRPICMQAQSPYTTWQSWYLRDGVGIDVSNGALINTSTTESRARAVASPLAVFEDPSSTSPPADFLTGGSASRNFTSSELGVYVPGSKTRLQTLQIPLANANFADPGIRSFVLPQLEGSGIGNQATATHRMMLEGPFQKLATQVFKLPVQITLGNAS